MQSPSLFSDIQVGALRLPNRVVMAPMTRNRASAGNVPGELVATYYTQRASAGLIVTEATQVTPEGVGYPNTPGIHTAAQVDGWKKVTQAVHQAGGRIFLQLWHVGRISHPLFQPNGQLPVAPSAIAPKGQGYTPEGMKPYVTPRALDLSEIPGIVEKFREGAKNAKAAGFDGVEIHGANGYLLDQFLRDGTNRRTDAYGGAIENRARLLLEVARAVIEVWGADRVGVRLSPSNTFNDMTDSDPQATFGYAIRELSRLGIAYVHLIETSEADLRHGGRTVDVAVFRPLFKGVIITNGGYTAARAEATLKAGTADLIAFGVPFISNPDLVHRLKVGAPLTSPDVNSFYGGTDKGYTDYPVLASLPGGAS